MTRRQLPTGIQDFRTIREEDCYYVDKTPLIRELVEGGRHYFLSRPRRFGKSLLVSTLEALFEGQEELFEGLEIHGHWDWSMRHPVVHLQFGAKYTKPEDLEGDILTQLAIIERQAGLSPTTQVQNGPQRLRDLLSRLHEESGQPVVVLVDEYDKPILDVLKDTALSEENRDYLRGFYGVIKDSAKHVRFVFVTGVSMFSKVSLFSGLNNLEDISLNPRYATVCGYTDADLDAVFAAELEGLDRNQIRAWYNGYNWLGEEKVYNPFDILLLFGSRKFETYWFETGSPEFLFQMLMEKEVSLMELENRLVDKRLVSKFDVRDIGVEALLFQTGYLTIHGEERQGTRTRYRLGYPNLEVEQSLNGSLLEYVTHRKVEAEDEGMEWARLLAENDFEGFGERFQSFLAGVPYPWHDRGDLGRYESWYASLLYTCFRTLGVDLRVEEASSRGRSDLVVLHGGQVFVLEFKMAEDDGQAEAVLEQALAQIRERGYGEKYRERGEPIHHVGLVFGRAQRNLLGVRAERDG